jgi:hypothetical protein
MSHLRRCAIVFAQIPILSNGPDLTPTPTEKPRSGPLFAHG